MCLLACSTNHGSTAETTGVEPKSSANGGAVSRSESDTKPAATGAPVAAESRPSEAKSAEANGGSAAPGSSADSDEPAGHSASAAGGGGMSHAATGGMSGAASKSASAGGPPPVGLDAGVDTHDALMGTASCCTAHDSKGCTNGQLQACVCAKLPSCCTGAWTAECVDYVMQKNCQAGVRDCVCGSADGQWQQTDCCQKNWNTTCDTVAESKCGATRGCF